MSVSVNTQWPGKAARSAGQTASTRPNSPQPERKALAHVWPGAGADPYLVQRRSTPPADVAAQTLRWPGA